MSGGDVSPRGRRWLGVASVVGLSLVLWVLTPERADVSDAPSVISVSVMTPEASPLLALEGDHETRTPEAIVRAPSETSVVCRLVVRFGGQHAPVPRTTRADFVEDGSVTEVEAKVEGAQLHVVIERPSPRGILTVRVPGFADEIIRIDRCPTAPLSAVLDPEVAFSGHLSSPPGCAVSEFTLVAWPTDIPFHEEWLDPSRPENLPAGVLVCHPSLDGSFEFRGARARRLYSLYGGGNGAILAERATFIVAPKEGISLSLLPAFCAIVEFHAPGGAALVVDQGQGTSLEFAGLDPTLRPMMGRKFEAVLAGLDRRWLGTADARVVALCVGSVWSERAGPLLLTVAMPGYPIAQRQFDAARLDRPPVEVDCEVVPHATGFGRLTMNLVDTGDPQFSGPWFPLRVFLTDESGIRLEYFHSGRTSQQVVEHVPFGTYRVEWLSDMGAVPGAGLDREPFEVVVSSEARIDIPIASAGIVEVQVVDEKGNEYEGPLNLSLGRIVPGEPGKPGVTVAGQIALSYDTPPSSIRLPAAGDWAMKIGWPQRDRNVHQAAFDSIHVPAGSAVRQLIVVKP